MGRPISFGSEVQIVNCIPQRQVFREESAVMGAFSSGSGERISLASARTYDIQILGRLFILLPNKTMRHAAFLLIRVPARDHGLRFANSHPESECPGWM
jgi:hypothetical protein